MSTKEVNIFRPWTTTKSYQCSNDNTNSAKTTSRLVPERREKTDLNWSNNHRKDIPDYTDLSSYCLQSEFPRLNNNNSSNNTSGGYLPVLDPYWNALAADLYQQQPQKTKQRPKKFRCPHCQVGFSNNGQLKGHVRIHTGERPFKCDAEGCGKKFTRNEELTRHKRIHTGQRPFACNSCGKRFGRKDHLKKHARTHMPQTIPLPIALYPYFYSYCH